MRLLFISLFTLCFSVTIVVAQTGKIFSDEEKKVLNWYNLDPVNDKIWGASTEKAYKDFLSEKKLKIVVVAVIDGGVDTKHEDLEGKMWVNEKEIPGNGVDDDKNGFIDDIHGWNFLGNSKGENIDYETLEVARLFKKYSDIVKEAKASGTVPENLPDMALLKKIDEVFREEFEKAKKITMMSCSLILFIILQTV